MAPYSFNCNVNEGLLQTTITDLAFDKNNFCWISFPNGIQKFDGENFTNVPVQAGLPDDKTVYFFRCSNGDLLLSHSHGISKYKISSNRFIQVYAIHAGEKMPAQFIGEDEKIIYFFTETGNITGIDCSTFKVVSDTKTGLQGDNFNCGSKPSDNIINHKVARL